MPSSYSTNLKIELQATGENSGTWGTITNTNLGTALEQAIIGYGNPNYLSDANLTLTYTDTNSAQTARALVLNVTSALSLTGTRELVVPTIQKQYIVQNNTTGAQSITVKTSGGTGITVPNGRKAHLYVDGTNVIFMDDFVDINGGTIDGTTIGGSSAAAGTFTTLTASSIATFAAGTAAAPSITTTGDTNTGIFFPAADTIAFTEGGVEAMRINSSANVGIGATTPSNTAGFSRQLQIEGTTAALTLSGTTGTGKYTLGVPGANAVGLWDNTASAYRWYVDSSGNLGIGTSSPGQKLEVAGNILINTSGNPTMTVKTSGAGNNPGYLLTADTNTWGMYGIFSDANDTLQWQYNGTTRLTLTNDGNLGIGTTSPGVKLDVVGAIRSSTTTSGSTVSATTDFRLNNATFSRVAIGDGGGGWLGGYSITYSGGAVYSDTGAISGIYYTNGGNIQFYAGGSAVGGTAAPERMRLDSSGNLGIGTSSPGCRLNATQAASAALGAQIALHNNAATAVGNAVEIALLTDGGASPSGIRNGRIRAVNENVGNGAANMQFWTWNGSTDAERMRLTSTGLGITEGNAPTQVLSLYRGGSTNAIMSAGNSNTGLDGTWFGVDTAGNGIVNVRGAFPLIFSTSALERARITSGGDLLVGTTSQLYGERFNVTRGGAGTNCATFYFNTSDDRAAEIIRHARASGATQASMIAFLDSGGTERGTIKTDGSATAYNTSSDRRLKENIASADEASSVIDAIKIVKHNWKSGGHVRFGVIAQDLHQVAPEAVSAGDDGEEIEKTWGVDYSKLVPMLVKEIQSLRARVAQLETK